MREGTSTERRVDDAKLRRDPLADFGPVHVTIFRTRGSRILRVGRMTRSFAETVIQDAMDEQPGACVVVAVPRSASEADILKIRERFRALDRVRTPVTIDRSGLPTSPAQHPVRSQPLAHGSEETHPVASAATA